MRSGGKYAWNYLLYLRYLRSMDEAELNGLEKYAKDLFEEGRSVFVSSPSMPLYRAAGRR